MKRTLDNHLTARYLPSLALIISLLLPLPSLAATVNLATIPLQSATTGLVKPNLMFVLDDSGSMSWTHMPDAADDFFGQRGYASSQCNGVYYNPAITYLPPLRSDGFSYPNATFTAAQYDGYNPALFPLNTSTGTGTVDLSSKFRADMFVPYSTNALYHNSGTTKSGLQDPEQAAYYYSYSGSQTTKNYGNGSSFYNECHSNSNNFTKVTVGAGEQQNFANWYSYYRTRMLTMKTSASRAFSSVSSSFRVGYLSINNNTNSDFLNISDFDSAQKLAWYAKLFAAIPSNGTPLRSALSTAGLIYGGIMTGRTLNGSTVTDPTQYSCQQNFALLATDGYWNTGNDSGCSGRGGQGCELNRTSGVGDQDGGSTPRPMYEGGTASSNSLADVAKYYYDTDLRTSNCTGVLGFDVCANNVFVSGTDNNVQQHMTTFTLGLGVNGTLAYSSDYKTATSGDYFDIKNGTKNWPKPVQDTATAVDDLWHAAVNGQGTYFSAKDPVSLASGLSGALASIKSKAGAGTAAATSTLNPVAGDNLAYVASYTTVKWTGNLEARSIDVSTGAVSEAATWCAEDVALPVPCTGTMAAKVSTITDTRNIWMSNGTSLVDFTYANLTAAGLNTNFDSAFLGSNLSQWTSLPFTTAQQTAAAGTNLVNFLRGQNGFEDRAGNAVDNRLYRAREAVLGDAVESTPAYIAKPTFSYTDLGYSAFKTAQASRAGTVYMGTNDGMLHAFDSSNGNERWAYVPSMVIPNMWKLADKNYSTMHTYYANGSPIISDICTASCTDAATAVWRTILVAGLDGGGRGYYALDITNPGTPSLLWEFSDNDLGYTFGDPVITKKADGTWVALITSGYNNTSPGNGQGYLYVLNANTGSVISKIGTGVGTPATPSGLARIAAYADDAEKNNTATYTYGGDLLGNLWRFDINAAAVPGTNPLLFATLKDSGGNPQPITTRPELGIINKKRVVFVGTGKYLEISDLTDTQQQTLYAIEDDNASATLVNPRTTLVQQTLTTSGATRSVLNTNSVDFTTGRGWYVNFPDSGERQNVPGQLVLGTLLIPTTVPLNTPCSPGGYGWLNYFNYKTGGRVLPGSSIVSSRANSPIVGVNVFYIGGVPKVSIVTSDHPTPDLVPEVPFVSGLGGFQKKRAIWRELIQ